MAFKGLGWLKLTNILKLFLNISKSLPSNHILLNQWTISKKDINVVFVAQIVSIIN